MEITQLLAEGVDDEAMTLTKLEVQGDISRFEAGLWSAVPVSERESSFRGWLRVTEGRWEGYCSKAKSLNHQVFEAISVVKGRAMREQGAP